MTWDYSLSPSKLNLFSECGRCAYDQNVLKIERPKGLFPSLPGGIDRAWKEYVDVIRPALPPELAGLTGTFWGTRDQIGRIRNWRSGLKALLTINGKTVSFIGALDDLIREADGTYSPIDCKTRGSCPKDDGSQYYLSQLDAYSLLLQENNLRPSGLGYLWYVYPEIMSTGAVQFASQVFTLTVSPARALQTIDRAVEIMNGGQPDWNPLCEYCKFSQARVEAALKVIRV